MNIPALQVQMLGLFSIKSDSQEISDNDNRSRKVWLLLAYLIYNRSQTISQEDLIQLLWGDSERSSNPVNALKTMLHRARTFLGQLDGNDGHSLIVRRAGQYTWAPNVSLRFDVEEFELHCEEAKSATDSEIQLKKQLQALGLYQGDFLPKLNSEPWVASISSYLHNLYLQTLLETLPVLESRGQLDLIETLCRKAIEFEPYNEAPYQYLMRSLLKQEIDGAILLYEDLSERLFSSFGIMPSDETKAIYRDAMRTTNERAASLSMVQEQLKESGDAEGALICDYDFFKVIYHAEARALSRNGDAVHIGLLSMGNSEEQSLSKRSLDHSMDNLQEIIRSSLHRGDIATQYSLSQYLLILPQANYENSCKVVERIIKSFYRQYPHSPAQLAYSIQPLEPSE